jgi:hypothetical protein
MLTESLHRPIQNFDRRASLIKQLGQEIFHVKTTTLPDVTASRCSRLKGMTVNLIEVKWRDEDHDDIHISLCHIDISCLEFVSQVSKETGESYSALFLGSLTLPGNEVDLKTFHIRKKRSPALLMESCKDMGGTTG